MSKGRAAARSDVELEERVWQLFAGCVLDCRHAGSTDDDHAILGKYVPQAVALIQQERAAAVRAKLGDLYSLAPELRSPLWRRLRAEVAKLRAEAS
ncbi:MAG TPA: hypothetical protein VEQ66_03595 [Propionibacteriaceae bacterium]|nr:hypothetical protein [Propionibacteriaceae bacterium]